MPSNTRHLPVTVRVSRCLVGDQPAAAVNIGRRGSWWRFRPRTTPLPPTPAGLSESDRAVISAARLGVAYVLGGGAVWERLVPSPGIISPAAMVRAIGEEE